MPTPKDIEPPLVDVKVTNPLIYIKKWWAKIIGNEGISLSIRVRPLTALAIAVVIASIGFGVGRFVLPFPIPFFEYNNPLTTGKPQPTIDPWKETAFTGNLIFSGKTNKYYLQVSSSSEVITLEVPSTIDLDSLIGKRIFAVGTYNKSTKLLVVDDAKDLEILPKSPIPIPTVTPSPTPRPEPSESPIPTPPESATNTY